MKVSSIFLKQALFKNFKGQLEHSGICHVTSSLVSNCLDCKFERRIFVCLKSKEKVQFSCKFHVKMNFLTQKRKKNLTVTIKKCEMRWLRKKRQKFIQIFMGRDKYRLNKYTIKTNSGCFWEILMQRKT